MYHVSSQLHHWIALALVPPMTVIEPLDPVSIDILSQPDLHPLYPTPVQISDLLTSLSSADKSELIAHCASRASTFGDLPLLLHLITEPHARAHLDLGTRDEDGLGLISLAIHGFGGDNDRDVEREECVRLLVTHGADMQPDNGMLTFQLVRTSCSS